MTEIKFGTSGWRGIIAQDFTFRQCPTGLPGNRPISEKRAVDLPGGGYRL